MSETISLTHQPLCSSRRSPGGSAESEDQYEQLVEAGDKSAFLQTLDRRESANLASFMRTKYADDIGRVQHEVADELAVRILARSYLHRARTDTRR